MPAQPLHFAYASGAQALVDQLFKTLINLRARRWCAPALGARSPQCCLRRLRRRGGRARRGCCDAWRRPPSRFSCLRTRFAHCAATARHEHCLWDAPPELLLGGCLRNPAPPSSALCWCSARRPRPLAASIDRRYLHVLLPDDWAPEAQVSISMLWR